MNAIRLDSLLLQRLISHIAATADRKEQIWQLKTMGFEDDDLEYFGYTRKELNEVMRAKTYQVETYPYAGQHETTEVPARIALSMIELKKLPGDPCRSPHL
jgi:hypothetical protein